MHGKFKATPLRGQNDETRREHFQELHTYLGLLQFRLSNFRKLVHGLADLAMQTDKGLVFAAHALETLSSIITIHYCL